MAMRWSSEFYLAMEHKDLQANAMAIDKTGTYVLLAGRRYIAIKNLEDADLDNVKKFPRQSKYDVSTAEWNPTSHHTELCVISCNQRLEVLTWRIGELTQMHSLRAHTRVITDLNWHRSDPNILASCSVDAFLNIWDMRDPRKPASSLSTIAEASQVRWNRVSSDLLATAHDGDVKLWDRRKGTAPLQYISAHLSKIYGLDWNPNVESQLVTSSQDSTVKFFDVNNPRRAEYVLTTNAPVWRARFTPFGTGLMTVVVPQLRRGENSLLLWNTSSRSSPVYTFVGHRDVVLEFEWREQKPGETDYQLVTWSKDQTLLVWRVESYLQKLCGHDPSKKVERHSNGIDVVSEMNVKTQKVQPIQQEFSLLNVQIPNLEVMKMDVIRRCCTAVAKTNNYSVILQVNFPSSYPNGVPPVFQIGEGSTVDETVANKLLQTLSHTAQQRVSKNRTCLEPCLRQFVLILEQLVDPVEGTKLHQNVYMGDTDILGSFNDACIPFPRTSGAKFCSVSVLVCFGRRPSTRRASVRIDSSTPRALSALGNSAFSNRRASDYTTVYSYYFQKQRSRFKQSTRSAQKAVVTVYDAGTLFSINKHLGAKYVLDGDLSRICKHNAQMAESVGRCDLVQVWTLAQLIVSPHSSEFEDSSEHPFGMQLIQSLITHYASHSDLQTAAMLSCVFGKGRDQTAQRKSFLKYLSSGQLASGRKWLKSENATYHTIPPADVVADGWVFPLMRTTRSNSLDNLRVEELPQFIPQRSPPSALCEYYKLAYAEILHRWSLLYSRAEVLKYLCTPAELHKGVEFLTDCQRCKLPVRCVSCTNCRKLLLKCIICHVSVKGSANCCLVCGHGGHTHHIQQWFQENTVCPTGCGCKCLIETAGVFDY